MNELIQKWRELSDKNFVDETLADSMEMDSCAASHGAKGAIYKQCADELEAALKAFELAQLSHNIGSPKCRCICQQSPVINGQITLAVDDSCPCHSAALRAGA